METQFKTHVLSSSTIAHFYVTPVEKSHVNAREGRPRGSVETARSAHTRNPAP